MVTEIKNIDRQRAVNFLNEIKRLCLVQHTGGLTAIATQFNINTFAIKLLMKEGYLTKEGQPRFPIYKWVKGKHIDIDIADKVLNVNRDSFEKTPRIYKEPPIIKWHTHITEMLKRNGSSYDRHTVEIRAEKELKIRPIDVKSLLELMINEGTIVLTKDCNGNEVYRLKEWEAKIQALSKPPKVIKTKPASREISILWGLLKIKY